MPAKNRKEEDREFLVRLPEKLHYELKLISVKHRLPMATIIRNAVKQIVSEHKRDIGNKKNRKDKED